MYAVPTSNLLVSWTELDDGDKLEKWMKHVPACW